MVVKRLFTVAGLCAMLALSACDTSGAPTDNKVDPLIDTGWFQLRNEATGTCLDGGGSFLSDVYLRACDNGDNDNLLWRFKDRARVTSLENNVDSNGRISDRYQGEVKYTDDLCLSSALYLQGCPLHADKPNTRFDAWQSFQIGNSQNPSIIRSVAENEVLGVENGQVVLEPRNPGDTEQSWSFIAR